MYRVRRIAEYHVLQNGTTTHGGQSRELTRRMDPLTYYYKEGPLGDIFAKVAQKPVRRVAMVGLGTGTIACYGAPRSIGRSTRSTRWWRTSRVRRATSPT